MTSRDSELRLRLLLDFFKHLHCISDIPRLYIYDIISLKVIRYNWSLTTVDPSIFSVSIAVLGTVALH